MMISDAGSGWDSKVNFVDENNVLLGYDMAQDCCENAGWFISESAEPQDTEGHAIWDNARLAGWAFDPDYFSEYQRDQHEEGGAAVFRIFLGDEEAFVHIFNCHNGYYGHGFSFRVGEMVRREGSL